jgi:hypothetical protein
LGKVGELAHKSGRRRHDHAMNMTPIIIILASVVLVGIITIMLRKTISHDRAAIASDMDEPHEIDTYRQQFGGEK